ncbi:MAG TPA: NAD-dependent deacylase [Usitatibacter sp.]|nr:NAD-dependent deacylase [Usitatibacter sp.]
MTVAAWPAALLERARRARHVVVFTGAGVSAESGIATFRDALTGLWERFDAEQLATPGAFRRDPALVWGWYEWRRMRAMRAQPNAAHRAIAALEGGPRRLTVITQNVDDLHERAGSRTPVHLHGSLFAPRCFDCGEPAAISAAPTEEPDGGRRLAPPKCGRCGGLVRPGVVWFGEPLPAHALDAAFDAAAACDVLFSVGTSSLVHPAAQVPIAARDAGAIVVQVNPNATPLDRIADLNVSAPAALALPALLDSLRG